MWGAASAAATYALKSFLIDSGGDTGGELHACSDAVRDDLAIQHLAKYGHIYYNALPEGYFPVYTRAELEAKWAEDAGFVVDQAIGRSTIWESMTGKAGLNVDRDKRYIDTERLRTIDLQHVVSAAMGPPGTTTFGTIIFESVQRFTAPDSSFAPEDIKSNVVGGVAARDAGAKGISIGSQVEIIIRNAHPKGPPYGRK